jgi:hypothetical protein
LDRENLETNDLFEQKNLKQVLITLSALGRAAAAIPGYTGPTLAVADVESKAERRVARTASGKVQVLAVSLAEKIQLGPPPPVGSLEWVEQQQPPGLGSRVQVKVYYDSKVKLSNAAATTRSRPGGRKPASRRGTRSTSASARDALDSVEALMMGDEELDPVAETEAKRAKLAQCDQLAAAFHVGALTRKTYDELRRKRLSAEGGARLASLEKAFVAGALAEPRYRAMVQATLDGATTPRPATVQQPATAAPAGAVSTGAILAQARAERTALSPVEPPVRSASLDILAVAVARRTAGAAAALIQARFRGQAARAGAATSTLPQRVRRLVTAIDALDVGLVATEELAVFFGSLWGTQEAPRAAPAQSVEEQVWRSPDSACVRLMWLFHSFHAGRRSVCSRRCCATRAPQQRLRPAARQPHASPLPRWRHSYWNSTSTILPRCGGSSARCSRSPSARAWYARAIILLHGNLVFGALGEQLSMTR